VQRISQPEHTCQIINHYGPTETTVGSLTFSVDESDSTRHSATVPIGRPIGNTRLYILDGRMQPVPIGVAGELYLGGAGVTAGYLNQPTETAARFVTDPFAGDVDSRLYRTGDLARYLADGNVEFLGRVDTQVKVRGYRVELGEIESALSACDGIRQAVVTARLFPGTAGVQPADDLNSAAVVDNRLVAYLVTSGAEPPNLDALRTTLKQKLPDYMVPSAFVLLSSLPLTPNGKIDRAALPAPDEARPGLHSNFVAPRTRVEQQLADIWASLLKVTAVGVHDNFFDLGGHSLLGTQVVSRMRKEFQMEIPLRSLFESPTVAQLAKQIEAGAHTSDTDRLLAELESLSDEEAEALLAREQGFSKP
jgi:non-ribosomal peptide synthetase component F